MSETFTETPIGFKLDGLDRINSLKKRVSEIKDIINYNYCIFRYVQFRHIYRINTFYKIQNFKLSIAVSLCNFSFVSCIHVTDLIFWLRLKHYHVV